MFKGGLIHVPSFNHYVCVVCGAIYGPEEPQVSAKSCTDCGAAWFTPAIQDADIHTAKQDSDQAKNDRTKIIIGNSQRAKDIIDILLSEDYEVTCCLIDGGNFYKIELVHCNDGKVTGKKFEE